uniref:tRNA wybutosine-synthesizing protein 2 homolog n=1 Tax=Romanomermis culicivorax TaxID=13658 RepID=A0A915JQ92_ROMCU
MDASKIYFQKYNKKRYSSHASPSLDKRTFNFTVETDCVAVDKPCDVGVIMPLLKPFLFRLPNLNPLILIDSLRLEESHTSLAKLIEHVTVDAKVYPSKEFLCTSAQVLLDKIPKCQTVVNKNENVNGLHRNLNFELLAGKEQYVTKVKENGLIFELDYSKVFFNPRLGTERERFLDFLQPGDLIYDVFAGVGPFSIQAAVLKRCRVLANDINPDCTRYLERNKKLNRADNVQVYTMDGEKFMTEIAAEDLAKQLSLNAVPKACHFIMNLPAKATEFLKFFLDVLSGVQLTERAKQNLEKIKIFVHCYYFAKKYYSNAHGERNSEDVKLEATDIIKKEFNDATSEIKDLRVDFVRSVAPSKHMMRATFSINRDILCRHK